MKRKEAVNKLERLVRKVPTWLFITGAVVVLSFIALWLEGAEIQSFRDAVKVLFENAESIAIVTAVIFFFKEAPNRKAQKHYEAWQVIDHAAAAHVPTSYARIQALQDLIEDGVSLRGVNLPGAHLQEINLKGAVLISADLRSANLNGAILRGANLSGATLSSATLIDADLRGANLSIADLRGAVLGIANLRDADLHGADLQGANLDDADLRDAKLRSVNFNNADLRDADLRGADLHDADFHDANLCMADLRKAKNLIPVQVKSAQNWDKAIYDKAFRSHVGILLDTDPPERH
ncbi:pentapeptide repeat-containing protein [Oculatella sp. LEGE 06141]|uniref:pentapeptide repeat-containing protein n=1 Tax=Oculatella sp. LEGE 06141 TaxID=1828648 RepID=UPI001882D81C|nr:pentapeptide repeat-containing protein [Oculatella sp. LEGE 06141]MBE9181181.1 pentapeptide repeat-containing protein [Oculatella sp. LEGE 06141]